MPISRVLDEAIQMAPMNSQNSFTVKEEGRGDLRGAGKATGDSWAVRTELRSGLRRLLLFSSIREQPSVATNAEA